MLNEGGKQANSESPVGAIHEVCYAFILRMRAYYTDISWTDIESKADEFQVDVYSALLADPSAEEVYRHAWTPLPRRPTLSHSHKDLAPHHHGLGKKRQLMLLIKSPRCRLLHHHRDHG